MPGVTDIELRAGCAVWQDGVVKLRASALPPAMARQLAHVLQTGDSDCEVSLR